MDKINTKLPYEGYCVSRQGGRSENQDTYGFVDTPIGLLVVICDGMGGGPAGKTASVLAVDTILNSVKQCIVSKNDKINNKQILASSIKDAEKVIIKYQEENPALKGMGTTVVALLISDRSAVIAHVGDSRCYQLRFGRKKFRTEDHSFVGELVRNGQLTEEQARLSSQSNIITRALSGRCNGEPDIDEVAYEKGDRFILCTDGIWGTMPEKKLIKRMGEDTNLPFLVEKLAADIDELGVNNGGGHDNLTISIIKTKEDSKLKEPMTRKYRFILILLSVISILCVLFGLFSQCSKTSALEIRDKKIEILQNRLDQVHGEVENSYKKDIEVVYTQQNIDSLKEEIISLIRKNDSLTNNLNHLSRELLLLKEKNKVVNEQLVTTKDVQKVSDKAQKVKVERKIVDKKSKRVATNKDIDELVYIKKRISTIVTKNTKYAKQVVASVRPSLENYIHKFKNTSAGNILQKALEELNKYCAVDDRNKDKRNGQISSIQNMMQNAINELKR